MRAYKGEMVFPAQSHTCVETLVKAIVLKNITSEGAPVTGDNQKVLTKQFPRASAIWLIVVVALSVALALSHSPLAPFPGVVTMLVLPGASVMGALRARPSNTSGRLVLAVSLSMLAIMVVGCSASLIGPYLGLARPLDPMPEIVIWSTLAIFELTLGTIMNLDPVSWVFQGVRTSQIYSVLTGGLLVVLSILGVAQLNHSGNNHLAIVATYVDVVVLLVGVVGGWSRESNWPLCTMLYSASLALLLSASLRGAHLYGWDIQKEFGVASHTIYTGRWAIPANHDPYASMLSLTVLPAVLASLTKLRLLAFFQLVVPAILALLPVAAFTTIRGVPRLITVLRPAPRPGLAFAVVVALVVSSQAFSSELVSITRQAMALTMLTTLVMVLYDRAMSKQRSRIFIGLLMIAISFTHYTTSYLLAGILFIAWPVSFAWSRGWLGTPRARIQQHRPVVGSRKMVNSFLVGMALVAAFGWNLGITRNYALTAASSAVTTKGAGFVTSTSPVAIPAPQIERILESELHQSASWLRPISGSASVRLTTAGVQRKASSPSVLDQLWNKSNFILQESLWLLSGAALLYGLFRLGRRQSNHYSPDLVGLNVAALVIGVFLRFSGTLASFYSPSRAAIIVAILVAAPVTIVLDDLVTLLNIQLAKVSMIAGTIAVGIMNLWATGLGALLFGGVPPGSLTATGINAEIFTVSTSELATAVWLKNNVSTQGVVQTDEYGQLVLLSEPAGYDLVSQMVPTEVGRGSFIYLSTLNLVNGLTTVTASNGNLYSTYVTTLSFFNQYFNVVYSNGTTRVYR